MKKIPQLSLILGAHQGVLGAFVTYGAEEHRQKGIRGAGRMRSVPLGKEDEEEESEEGGEAM